MNKWQVENRVIVVAGASKGIGYATARALVERGARVALLARDRERLDRAVAELKTDDAFGVCADVSDRKAVEVAYQTVWDRWGRFDGLVNNVGRQFARRIEAMAEEEVTRLVRLNLISTIFSCQAAIPLLRKNGGGRIINISSSAVRDDNEFAHIGVYTACKAAVDQFTCELRKEVMRDGILLTLFSSGGVETGGTAEFDQEALAEAFEAWLENGKYYGGFTTPEVMGEAIAGCFEYPDDIAPEFIEVKKNVWSEKGLEDPTKG